MESPRYPVKDLMQFAEALFVAAGLDAEKAKCVAQVLVTGDMVGQRTHGMKLCAPYVDDLEKGQMKASGEPEVVRDSGAVIVWDGHYLPGPWLVSRALAIASERVVEHGVVRFDVLEPTQRLRTRYTGGVLELAEPRAMADPRKAFAESPRRELELDLEHEAVGPMYGGRSSREESDGGDSVHVLTSPDWFLR